MKQSKASLIRKITLKRTLAFWFAPCIYADFAKRLHLCGDEAVLDYECGGGEAARFTAAELKAGCLFCCEQNLRNSMKKRLLRKGNVVFLQTEELAEAKYLGYFDVIYCHFAQEISPALPAGSFAKLLKNNGRLYLRQGAENGSAYAAEQSLSAGLDKQYMRITHIKFFGNTLESCYKKT